MRVEFPGNTTRTKDKHMNIDFMHSRLNQLNHPFKSLHPRLHQPRNPQVHAVSQAPPIHQQPPRIIAQTLLIAMESKVCIFLTWACNPNCTVIVRNWTSASCDCDADFNCGMVSLYTAKQIVQAQLYSRFK